MHCCFQKAGIVLDSMKISENQDLRMQLKQVTIFCPTQMARYNSIGHETAYFLWDIYVHDIITHIIAPLLFTSMVLIHQSKILIYVNRYVDLYDFFLWI